MNSLTVQELLLGINTENMTIADRRKRLLDLIAADPSAREQLSNFADAQKLRDQMWRDELTRAHVDVWDKAADCGWYPNGLTPLSSSATAIRDGVESLDNYMLNHLKHDAKKLRSALTTLHHARKQILLEAFTLMDEQRYAAAIPLLLAQSDGICHDRLGWYLFTDTNERRESIPKVFSAEDQLSQRSAYFLESVRHYSARMNQAQNANLPVPNRHGVMHGAAWHLNYGTEVNAYKCFSLLAFVSFLLFD